MTSTLRLFIKPLISNNIPANRPFHRWLAPTLKTLRKRKEQMGPQPPSRRSDFIEWNYKAELYSFGKRIGENFKEDFLRQAFTERSYIDLEEERQRKVGIEPQIQLKDNSALALDGEKFMSGNILQYLKIVLPRLPEEYAKTIHNDLMSEEHLVCIAKNIGIDDLVLCSEIPPSKKALSRSLKSAIQALVLSSGEDRASILVRDLVLTQLAGKDITPLCTPQNPLKDLQASIGSPTESRLIAESGKNSLLANYQVGIYVDKKLLGRGCGESPEVAEEMAALDSLWRIWGIPSNRRPFSFKIELPPAADRM